MHEKITATLTDSEWKWLTSMASSQNLPNEGKAFRCCINFISQAGDAAEQVMSAAKKADAAGAAGGDDEDDKSGRTVTTTPHDIPLAASQLEWLRKTVVAAAEEGEGGEEEERTRSCSSVESYAGVIVRACMRADPDDVFGVIRCKNAIVSRGKGDVAGLADETTVCQGAQEAIASPKKKCQGC